MKAIYLFVLLVLSLFAVQAQPPPADVGDKEKPVLCEEIATQAIFGIIEELQTCSVALPCKFCFDWNDGRLCGIERVSETIKNNTALNRESKRPRDWLSKI